MMRVAGSSARLPGTGWRWLSAGLARRPTVALGGLGAVVVVFTLLAGGAWWVQHTSGTQQADRAAALAAAKTTVSGLLTYDSSNIDALVARVDDDVTEGFRTDYHTLISQVIEPAAKQQQITTSAEIVGSSTILEESSADQVVALLFVNQRTQAGPNGALQQSGSRVRVVMQHIEERWLLADLNPI
ncbi:hypothetical protein [Pseudonocardia sp. T1-2H]|uniref:hypothetical protein n=1 Tax=Pseudonocardia sp. T1-2H TaxID=3128899 RepID=UPI00310144C6